VPNDTIYFCLNRHYPLILFTPAWGAMWILFVLSGYLLGKGFYNNKYQTDWNGMTTFWINRFIRILPMYLFFILLIFLFVEPQQFISLNYKILIPLLTFTYNGNPGIMGIGATWFISTIFQLYLLAPIVYKFVFSKIQNHKFWSLLVIIGLGVGVRLIENLFKMDYYTYTYTHALSNLDLFFAGMFLNSLTIDSYDNKYKKLLRPVSILIFLGVIILFTVQLTTRQISWLYRYIGPTIFLASTLLVIYSFDVKDKIKSLPLTFKNAAKNPLRLLEAFGIVSFGFYLYHSNILLIIPKALSNNHYNLLIYGTLLGAFIMTTVWAIWIYFMIEKPSNKFRHSMQIGKKND
jgi:peptidoglycan/LPS O-acetylase OafA/YrhL